MAVAVVGLTFAEAVDEVLESIGENPASPTSGTEESDLVYAGIAKRAMTFLSREKIRVLTEGWPENTLIAHTVTGLGGDVLRIKGAGKAAHRTLVLGESGGTQKIIDMNNGGAEETGSVVLDIVTEKTWKTISPSVRDVIVASAKVAFQRRMVGNPTQDSLLMQEYIQAEMRARRNQPRPDLQLPNIQPKIPGLNQSVGTREQQ